MKPASRALYVKLIRFAHAQDLPLPAYQSAGAAGLDLVAALPAKGTLILPPGNHAMVPTGIAIELPANYEAQVRPRSGLAARHGVTVLNSPGTIDADYRGEISVILINLGKEPFSVKRGDRIAQMIIAPVIRAKLAETRALTKTGRGADGFGSTGGAGAQKPKVRKTRNSIASNSRKKQSASSKRGSTSPR